MYREARLQMLARNAASRARLVAEIEQRRAISDLGLLPDTSHLFQDQPRPGRQLVRKEYAATGAQDHLSSDARKTFIDERAMRLIGWRWTRSLQ